MLAPAYNLKYVNRLKRTRYEVYCLQTNLFYTTSPRLSRGKKHIGGLLPRGSTSYTTPHER